MDEEAEAQSPGEPRSHQSLARIVPKLVFCQLLYSPYHVWLIISQLRRAWFWDCGWSVPIRKCSYRCGRSWVLALVYSSAHLAAQREERGWRWMRKRLVGLSLTGWGPLPWREASAGAWNITFQISRVTSSEHTAPVVGKEVSCIEIFVSSSEFICWNLISNVLVFGR